MSDERDALLEQLSSRASITPTKVRILEKTLKNVNQHKDNLIDKLTVARQDNQILQRDLNQSKIQINSLNAQLEQVRNDLTTTQGERNNYQNQLEAEINQKNTLQNQYQEQINNARFAQHQTEQDRDR